MKQYLECCYYYDDYIRRRMPISMAICVWMLWYILQEKRLAKRRIKYSFLLGKRKEARLFV
jgi:hypothetical protein